MNSISFTQTRSTLSSADLRISESLAKPLQTMNVETLEHSSSVTISIFDALAEILTSTPRTPRLSTTTAVTPNQNNKDKETLNGVSNSITVNSQDPLTTFADVNAYTKSVQITEQTTPIVFNNLSFGETATPSLNTEKATARPVNTSTPSPTPTTPLSARKPFAIKLLYSGPDTGIDKSTASDSTTSDKPSTDNPVTVFNKVSDLLLTNNNLVSSELTSMLSNNINNIMQNMDKQTRSKISVDDMANLLRTLIPRALNLNDDANIPETTPYSLEDIIDTANVKIGNKTVTDSNTADTLQAVMVDDSVNRAQTDIFSTLELLDTPSQPVNNVGISQGAVSSTLPVSSSQMMSVGTTATTAKLTTSVFSTTTPTTTTSVFPATSSGSVDTEMVNVNIQNNTLGVSPKNSTNTNVPLPFFTNFRFEDFNASDTDDLDEKSATLLQPSLLTTQSVSSSQTPATIRPQDSSQVSPLELWVLSKKARVLQMIEDLIRQHNVEIATAPPLTEILNQSNNIPLSNRLTEIINTMTSTTAVNNDDISSISTTPTINPFPLFTTLSPQTDISTNESPENDRITTVTTTTTTENIAAIDDVLLTTNQSETDLSTRFGIDSTTTLDTQTEATPSTTSATISQETTVPVLDFSNRFQQDTTQTNFQETEPTTAISDTETTQNIDTTTTFDLLTDTLASDENRTTDSQNDTMQNFVSVVTNELKVSNEPPKKDYVIFGILPNNTVVRKDPNDDILETITESSPYIVYGVLPNNTIIRRFPNGTRVPRVMQRVEVLPISPWSLRNPYSPIHNNPAIVRPQSNPIRVSTNIVTSTVSSNNGAENLTNDTVNNQQPMVLTLSSLA